MSEILFYNSRTRQKERFEPRRPGRVGMYTCGPTVYGEQHIGNVRSQLFADLLKRALLYWGFEVEHVINVTDVGHLTSDADEGDDKMELAARAAGQTANEIASHHLDLWEQDRVAIQCLPPEVLCRATEHIAEQIALAQILEGKGYTYRIEDGIYFDTARFPRYADLAHLDLAGQEEGARIGVVKGKRNPSDFAIWKFALPEAKRLQEWDSPWGRGFPGWHLECSAMSTKYLGESFDIHTGGIDLLPVHHSNEVAQSECAYGEHPWVTFWMHNEFLDMSGVKMSKSLGNVLTLGSLIRDGISALAYRYFFLSAHYRQQQSFSQEGVVAAQTGYRRLIATAASVRDAGAEGEAEGGADASADAQAPFRARFDAALRDDLNAPKAMASVWEVARSTDLEPADRRALLLDFDRVLGLGLVTADAPQAAAESDPRIDALVEARQAARASKDFAGADRIRDELQAEGVIITDTPDGPRWRRE